jgi:hypothetical protein
MKKKIVIAYLGRARNGKDTACDFAIEYLNEKTNLVSEHKSFAGLLKEQAKMMGWNGEKDSAGRTFLQELSSPIKNYYSNLAATYPENPEYKEYADGNFYPGHVYKEIMESDADVFHITDMRFLNEANYYEKKAYEGDFVFVTIRIDRRDSHGDKYYGDLTLEQRNHESETSLNEYKTDITYRNDGTLEDFRKAIREAMEVLVKSTAQ